MPHRLILKVTKFQLPPGKRLITVVKNIFFGGGGDIGRYIYRVKSLLSRMTSACAADLKKEYLKRYVVQYCAELLLLWSSLLVMHG